MRLWLDDLRPMPLDYDIHCRTAEAAVLILETDEIDHISFDHDLGTNGGTGYDVAILIESYAASGIKLVESWEIHSANPVGRKNIKAAMTAAERLLEKQHINVD